MGLGLQPFPRRSSRERLPRFPPLRNQGVQYPRNQVWVTTVTELITFPSDKGLNRTTLSFADFRRLTVKMALQATSGFFGVQKAHGQLTPVRGYQPFNFSLRDRLPSF